MRPYVVAAMMCEAHAENIDQLKQVAKIAELYAEMIDSACIRMAEAMATRLYHEHIENRAAVSAVNPGASPDGGKV
jgi:hypothetical protein